MEKNFNFYSANNVNVFGRNRANQFLNECIVKVCEIFKFKNWPFKNQTETEFITNLILYGNNAYFNINPSSINWEEKITKELIKKIGASTPEKIRLFVPIFITTTNTIGLNSNIDNLGFTGSDINNIVNSTYGNTYLNKLNASESTWIPIPNYLNMNIQKVYFTKEYKQKMPIIFINKNQIIPLNNIYPLLIALGRVYTGIEVNRDAKITPFWIGSKVSTDIKLKGLGISGSEQNVRPNTMLNTLAEFNNNIGNYGTAKKLPTNMDLNSIVKSLEVITRIPDYSTPLQLEANNLQNEIMKKLGIIIQHEQNKTSAQETDSQTSASDGTVLGNATRMLESLEYYFNNFNKINNTNVEISFNEYYKNLNKNVKESLKIPPQIKGISTLEKPIKKQQIKE